MLSAGFLLGGDPDDAWVEQADRVQRCMSAWHPGRPAQLQSETRLAESLLESAVRISRLLTASDLWGTTMLVYETEEALRADVRRILATHSLACHLVVFRAAHLRVGGAVEAWAAELNKDFFSPELVEVPGAKPAYTAGGTKVVFLVGNGDVSWPRLGPWLARQLGAARGHGVPTFVACTCHDLWVLQDKALKLGAEPKATHIGLDVVLLDGALRKETPLPSAKARKTEVSVGAAIDRLRARCHVVFGAVRAQKRKRAPIEEEELFDRRQERERRKAERRRAQAADSASIDAGFEASRLFDERAERSVLLQLDEHFDQWRCEHADGSVAEWRAHPEGLPAAAAPLRSACALLEDEASQHNWWRHLYRCEIADLADGGGGGVDCGMAIRKVVEKWRRAVRRSEVLRGLLGDKANDKNLLELVDRIVTAAPLFFPVALYRR